MNAKFKSVLSVILATIMLFSFTSVGFAENGAADISVNVTIAEDSQPDSSAEDTVAPEVPDDTTVPDDSKEPDVPEEPETPEEPEIPEEPENPEEPETPNEPEIPEEPEISEDPNEIVASFSIMSCVYFWPISGHMWLYVENLSDEPIQVGLYEVPVGEGVSVGSFAFTSRDGWGLYYNLEAFRENRDNNQANQWSITQQLNKAQLEDLSDDIAGYVNYWDFYFNCAFFAFSIWNANSDNFFIPLVIPAISQMEIRIAGAEKGAVKMYEPSRDQVFRQKGSLGNARLVQASDKTLDN